MDILICISHVPDTTTKIKFTADGKALDANGVTFVVNPYDEFGLARALELQEQNIIPKGKLVILSVGGPEVEPTLRKALAVGGDEAVRIDAPATDAYSVAHNIAAYAKTQNFGLIMMGKESIDNNGSEVPGMVAALLDLPFVSFTTSLTYEGGKAVLEREIDGGTETLDVEGPVVVSCQKGLAEWRIPNMRGIMAARTKPLHVLPAQATTPHTEVLAYELPPAKAGARYLQPEEVQELVKVLSEKGVI